MPSPEVFLFDTSAILTLIEREPGRDRVRELIEAAMRGELALHACFVSLTEVQYLVTYRRGPAAAAETIAELKALPVQWLHSDDALCGSAAEIKSGHTLSFADAFVAAAALRLGAVLVHKDPEFGPLGSQVKQEVLPLKGGAAKITTA